MTSGTMKKKTTYQVADFYLANIHTHIHTLTGKTQHGAAKLSHKTIFINKKTFFLDKRVV